MFTQRSLCQYGFAVLMDLAGMRATAPKVSALMKVLSNQHRLMILCQLCESERSVGELVHLLDIRQAALSQQLSRLRASNLVKTRREAQTIYYSIANEDLDRLLAFLYVTYYEAKPDMEAKSQ